MRRCRGARCPALMQGLRTRPAIAARCLEFVVLTAARSGEARGATWSEIDLEARTWTVPGQRMKAGVEHRVPLSDAAVDLLRALPRIGSSEYLFPNGKGAQLSDAALSTLLSRMAVAAVPHGFRSTFRDWCAESTSYPRELAEQALAHAVANKVEAAYRRSDLFERRRKLMRDWATFCLMPPAEKAATVVPIRKAGGER